MKFSLVAALVVVLAVAHGSEAGSLVKRDVQAEVDKITKLIRDMSATFTRETQDIVEKVKALEVTNSAQTYMEASKAQIQPLVDKVQAEATRMQEQLKPFLANIEDQLKPLGDNVNVHVKPLTDMMASFFQQVVDQTKALLPPQ
ncbi:putative type-4 ice-structuring protein LS-12-like [Scophthalmus maximus]|uniref:Putative type-4 ice-structuring protein LS-12-like n=1 Tax=Scophthalmus maximus TaxID=52904 RepID=A0A2U9CG84_SCOMX|nr:type-4 ice-structuring protein LS-12 [Scophthalmus maximus]AWP15625.1 putative type-4 ice-structuring protein LS-12-like [Scophthalmus maximus]